MRVFQSTVFQQNVFQGSHDGVPEPNVSRAGARIASGHYSRGRWHELQEQLRRERLAADARRRRDKRRTDLERVERTLLAAEADLAVAIAKFTITHSRDAYAAITDAQQRIAEAEQQVTELRAARELEHTRVAADNARAERSHEAARAQAAAAAAASERTARNAVQANEGAASMRQLLEQADVRAMAARARTKAMLQDDDEVIEMLLRRLLS